MSQTSAVLEWLRDDIIYGRLAPGTKLKIEALQKRYDMGSTPLREALSLLSATGLVERIDNRGFRVASVSAEDYAEILWTRCFIEERALREAILYGDRTWEEQIVLAQYHLLRASELANPDEPASIENWEKRHAEFHAALISACRSKFLLRFCAQLYDAGNRYRYIARLAPGARAGSYEEHKRLADAVLKRDADVAVAVLVEHFKRTGELLKDRLDDFDPKSPLRPDLKTV